MSEPDPPLEPEANAVLAAMGRILFNADVREILTDAVLVVLTILTIYVAEAPSHALVPPEGPLLFPHTRFEFPLQWMLDLAHVANLGRFIIRVVRRIWQ